MNKEELIALDAKVTNIGRKRPLILCKECFDPSPMPRLGCTPFEGIRYCDNCLKEIDGKRNAFYLVRITHSDKVEEGVKESTLTVGRQSSPERDRMDEELIALLGLQSAHIPTVDDRKEKHDEDLREDLIRDGCSFEFADRMSVKQSLKGEEL